MHRRARLLGEGDGNRDVDAGDRVHRSCRDRVAPRVAQASPGLAEMEKNMSTTRDPRQTDFGFQGQTSPPPEKPDLTAALGRLRSGRYARIVAYLKGCDDGASLEMIRRAVSGVTDELAFSAIQDLKLLRFATIVAVNDRARHVRLTAAGRRSA